MTTVDLGNFISVDYTAAAGAIAPATAYANWAAELGVSPTASLYAMDADDGSWAVNFAAPPMVNSPLVVGMVSSEGGVGLYKRAPINTGAATVTNIPNVSRMNLLTDRPDVLFTFHPQADLKSVGMKLQRSGTTTIIGGRVQQFQSTTTPINVADFAMRMNGSAGLVLIVSAPAGDTPVPLYVMDGSVSLAGALMDTVAAGTIREISALVTNNSGSALSAVRLDDLKAANSLAWTGTPVAFRQLGEGRVGRKNFSLGDRGASNARLRATTKDKGSPNIPVSERVRLYRQRDGLLIRETWSAPGTGIYSFDYIDETEVYTVISYDHDGNFRAVIADGLSLANGALELIA